MTISEDDLERILDAVETIEASLSVLAEKQSVSRETYRTDRETRDRREFLLCELFEGIVRKMMKDVLHRLIPEDSPLRKWKIKEDFRGLQILQLFVYHENLRAHTDHAEAG